MKTDGLRLRSGEDRDEESEENGEVDGEVAGEVEVEEEVRGREEEPEDEIEKKSESPFRFSFCFVEVVAEFPLFLEDENKELSRRVGPLLLVFDEFDDDATVVADVPHIEVRHL
jgi:hypothetical protein